MTLVYRSASESVGNAVREYLRENYCLGFFDVVLNTLMHRQCGYYCRSILRRYNIMFFHQVSERLKINLKNLEKEISLLFSWRCPMLLVVLRALGKTEVDRRFSNVC